MKSSRLQQRSFIALTALVVTSAVIGCAVFFGFSKVASGQGLITSPTVADATTCPVSTVTISRTPFNVRVEKQFADGTSVLTLDGVFASVPQGTTFHVTHVNAMFFTDGAELSQVRLYRGGKITEGFNLSDSGFRQNGSSIQSRTLNQPVDLYFPISADPGEYDLQLIRQSSNGVATGIAQFWGYLTTETCPSRG